MSRLIEHDIFGTVPRSKTINSKKKGDRNENDLCKTFLLEWTKQRFIRVPSSGGRRLQNNSTFCGDVVCENEDYDFLFAVETKHLKTLGLPNNGVLRSNSVIFKIWQQGKRDAIRANKYPLLALRRNGFPKGQYLIVVDRPLDIEHDFKGTKNAETLYAYWSKSILENIPYSKIVTYYD